MKKIIIGLIIYILTGSFSIFSAEWTTGITSIKTKDTGKVVILLDIGNSACSVGRYGVFSITSTGGKGMLSLAIAASLAGKNVKIYTNGCTSVNQHKITEIEMK